MAITSEKINGKEILVEIESSNLKSASYNTEDETLKVTFKSGIVYEYYKVPWDKFTKLRMAESQGRFFNLNIGRSYEYKKL
jgi:citrate synthase|tara:strand:+ start:306 stop:548 length:243 start_codon:yes stop_codon:yes gene_type:complete